MQYSIRPATSSDAAAIGTINKCSLGYDFDANKTKQQLDKILQNDNSRILVAEQGGDVVGYIHAADYACTYWEPMKNILALAVLERGQGQGIGRALLEQIEEWAMACGCSGVRLVSGETRTGAHAFYQACGYSFRKQQKNFIKMF